MRNKDALQTSSPRSSETIVSIKNLSISFAKHKDGLLVGRTLAVDDLSLEVKADEIFGIAGESGSGKSLTALSIPRLVPVPPARYEGGEILFVGKDTLKMSEAELGKLRGKEIGVIFQEPMTSLSPLHSIGRQVREAIAIHNPDLTKNEIRERALDALNKVGIKNPKRRQKDYPRQFSGGMRQRVIIAIAMVNEPRLIIADEPSTALDASMQSKIFELILKARSKNCAVIFISHDLGAVWELCDQVAIMQAGKIVESSDALTFYKNPKHPYSKMLLEAATNPVPWQKDDDEIGKNENLLNVNELNVWFPSNKNIIGKVKNWNKAVNKLSFKIKKGEIVGLLGESGSGKSTIGRSILSLEEIKSGEIFFENIALNKTNIKKYFPYIQIIFQDPFSSLNPKLTVKNILLEGLHNAKKIKKQDSYKICQKILREVGLEGDHLNRYPHEFSGGQRQRLCIARAIALKPKLLICDEIISALDVSLQARILKLLYDLHIKYEISLLFITHDIKLALRFCDKILVMRAGKLIDSFICGDFEEGEFEKERHEFTRELLAGATKAGDMSKRLR